MASNESTSSAAPAPSAAIPTSELARTAAQALASAGLLLRGLAASFDPCDGRPNVTPRNVAAGVAAALTRVRAASDSLASVGYETSASWQAAQEATWNAEGLLVVVHASLQRGFPGDSDARTCSPTADALGIAAAQIDAAAVRARRAAEGLGRQAA